MNIMENWCGDIPSNGYDNYYNNHNNSDGVSFYNFPENNQVNSYQAYENAVDYNNALYNPVYNATVPSFSVPYQQTVPIESFANDVSHYPPPCQGPQPWNYAYCYGYYGEAPCPYVDIIDMEDFMNNEKRKEKSRDAARCRRSRETEIFTELAQALPMKQDDVDHLDKASVMRLSIAFLKVRNILELFPNIKEKLAPVDKVDEGVDGDMPLLDLENEKFAIEALDGFLLVLSSDGDVTYVSENVHEHLGVSQIDMMGQPIWEYSHQCDHDEIREALNGRRKSPSELQKGTNSNDFQPLVHRDLFLRLKCTLTSRGRSVNIKSASYKVIHITGHIAYKEDGQRQFIAIGRPLPHPSNIEIPLGSSTFLTKHSLDMKFSYVDDKMSSLLGYEPDDLLNKSLYECHHGCDSEGLMATFKNLISKGQCETSRYRFLAKTGGYSWIVTQATILYDKQKPQSVVCVNYVISGVENKDEIYSCAQLEARQSLQQASTAETAESLPEVKEQLSEQVLKENINENSNKVVEIKSEIVTVQKSKTPLSANSLNIRRPGPVSVTASIFARAPPQSVTAKLFAASPLISSLTPIPLSNQQQRPQIATSKIFAPRTEDMNKGFLMFSDEEPGMTMLKDEPDDLTHLAPTAGDACIPLEEPGPFFNDMFDDFIIPDNYTSILQDDLNSLDSQGSSCKTATTTTSANNNDPFINYRDEISEISNSPHLLSPGLSKSPGASSLPSLCSPNGSLPEDELAFMTLNMEDELDLSMRAPYISMSEVDDLPLLTSDDLMWGAPPPSVDSCLTSTNSSGNLASLHNKYIIKDEYNNQLNINNNNNHHNREEQQIHKNHNLANSNNENNININNKPVDSSLAALLCGSVTNLQPQPHQTNNNNSNDTTNNHQILIQHQITSEPDEVDKKYKLTDQNLLHPMLVISPGYKTCNTIDTWTMNDLLQLNGSNNGNALPMINNNNKMNQAIITSIVSKKNANNNKRSANESSPNAKRVKSGIERHSASTSSNSSSSSSPQLLQQLMAPSPVPQKAKSKKCLLDQTRWNDGLSNGQLVGIHDQSSNSVLMNLLVSGCDNAVPDILLNQGEKEERKSNMKIDEDDDLPYLSNPLIGGVRSSSPIENGKLRIMSVSTSLFTATDMEIWRAIQQGMDPKKIIAATIPTSMRTTPTPLLSDKELLSVLDPAHLIDMPEQDYEMNIPVNEILQNALMI